MAMLAGPRRKQKVINLRGKNNDWSNDSNKFGQKMLEKMGWSEGKGLGAKENGIVEHVVARYKNDERGLGFEDKNDQWTKHEDDFNALLANLSNGTDSEEKLHSGVSLEVKSKKSKARVHYHKFTRGKDISRYTEKDLANIFGKKTFKTNEVTEESDKEDLKTTEQIFTEKGSMEDYFKNKFKSLNSKNSNSFSVAKEEEDYDADYSFKGFSGTSNIENDDASLPCHNLNAHSFYNNSEIENSTPDEDTLKSKKSKKKKKEKLQEEIVSKKIDNEINTEEIDNENLTEELKIKTKKKKKSKTIKPDTDNIIAEVSLTETINIGKKKSKKRKHMDTEILVGDTQNTADLNTEMQNKDEIHVDSVHVPKKKKKRKNKNNE